MNENNEAYRLDATIGAIVRYVVGYLAVFLLGWWCHSWYHGCDVLPAPLPQPAPYYPRPDSDTWYTPQRSVQRQLPSVLNDGVDRGGQVWRWEVNQRGEYRWHRVAGDAGAKPIGEAPKTVGARSEGRGASDEKQKSAPKAP